MLPKADTWFGQSTATPMAALMSGCRVPMLKTVRSRLQRPPGCWRTTAGIRFNDKQHAR